MKQNITLFSLILFISSFSFAQVSPQEMIAKMGRGINLGNILNAPKEGNWAPPLTVSYLEDVKSVGFKTVRIPIDFYGDRTSGNTTIYDKEANTANNYTGNSSDYIVDETYLDRIEEVIQWSLQEGLVTILDVHGSQLKTEFLYTFSPREKWSDYYTAPTSAKRAADNDKFRAIWKQIADRFKNYSDNLVFEVVNEPYFWLSDDEMDTLNLDIISIIRNSGSKNSSRNIIITGGSENAYEAPLQISDDVLSSDNNLIATFHYYKPREFTASSEEVHNDYVWGSNDDKDEIDIHFGVVKNWADSKNVSILLGEFGADNEKGIDYSNNTLGDFGGPEKASREDFHRYLSDKAIALGFAFTVWDAGDQSNKTFYKVSDRSWVTGVRNAVLGKSCLEYSLIKNADIECGSNSDWNLFVQLPAIASLKDAEDAESRGNSKSIEINVTNNGGLFNKTILRNKLIETTSFSNKTLLFSTYAKASINSAEFKIRIKTITTGETLLSSSSVLKLSNSSYQRYEYEFSVPENTTSLEFQVLCGKTAGNYFFDDFAMEEKTLNTETIKKEAVFELYPNPAQKYLTIKTTQKIDQIILQSVDGKMIPIQLIDQKIDISNYSAGVYFLSIKFSNGIIQKAKVLIIN
ncbi:cellulase family glycosylhydrolase [Polaribacter sp. R77954]|uniref:cellulase family glycosylhydrolase n=1 Tax=Polaribacter sp. R77954 TaxID=3093870 RepID=UPI0037CC883A